MNSDAISQVMGWFCKKHNDVLDVNYMISWGKDQTIIKQIISTYGINKTYQLINEFFKELKTDIFLQKTGASVGVFKSQLPKLLLKINKHKEKDEIGRL